MNSNASNLHPVAYLGFPGSPVGKESTCNAGNPSFTPGSGRSPGEGMGYPFQYSWASLVAQMINNLPAMRETRVRSLGRSPEGGHGSPLQYSCLENPHGRKSMAGYTPWGHRVRHDWATKHSTAYLGKCTALFRNHIIGKNPSVLDLGRYLPSVLLR